MSRILVPLPHSDFDPSETAVPWRTLTRGGIQCMFATPHGLRAHCDPRMLHGTGLGPLAPLLAADGNARAAYREMENAPEFQKPLSWTAVDHDSFQGLLLPGGHAPGMKEYLESPVLQQLVRDFFAANKPVAAVCHGVVLAARSKRADGKSVLHGRKTTSLLASQELLAWNLTRLWLGNYYRTYPENVESEVKRALEKKEDFAPGPLPLRRDTAECPGFAVTDGKYVSARWPGDIHAFANAFLKALD